MIIRPVHVPCIRLALFAAAMLTAGCALIDPPEKSDVDERLKALRITEINYHPENGDTTPGTEYEFIELKNTGTSTADLSRVFFSDGINYSFPSGTVLAPGAFIVLASNNYAFQERYGISPFGVYAGHLSNSGERVALEDMNTGIDFLSVTYGTTPPWPSSANGRGRSLVPVTADALGDPNAASYWRASFNKNGSPGKDDPEK
jgi:hypothetical protein